MQKSKYQVIRGNVCLIPYSTYEIEQMKVILNTDNIHRPYHDLYQIQALRDIHTPKGIIKKGTLGGYIEDPCNLNPFDESWIEQGGIVMQKAMVTGDSYIGSNVICRWAFVTPNQSVIESDHLIVIDHKAVYSSKHKAIVQTVGQDDALERYLANRDEINNALLAWRNAVPITKTEWR